MKFLLDENISNFLYNYLKNSNFDVKKVGIDIPSGITDLEVMEIALEENRIVITRDCGDIGKFIYRNNFNIKGVVCIKGNIRGQQEINAFNYINNNINSLIEKFIIIDKIKSGFKLKIRDL